MTDRIPDANPEEQTLTGVDHQISAAATAIADVERRLAAFLQSWCSASSDDSWDSSETASRLAPLAQAYGTLLGILEASPEAELNTFMGHIARAGVLRAEVVQLLNIFFCQSLSEARLAWGEVNIAAYGISKEEGLLGSLRTLVTERRQSLERVVNTSERCRLLVGNVVKELRPLVARKLDRQDTFQHLDEKEVHELRKRARCWLDDVVKMTEDMDENLKVSSTSLGRVAYTLLITQKRFLYALMDALESCLQLRLSWLLSVSSPNQLEESQKPQNDQHNDSDEEIPSTKRKDSFSTVHFGPMLQHLDDQSKFFPFPLLLGLHLDKTIADEISSLESRDRQRQEKGENRDPLSGTAAVNAPVSTVEDPRLIAQQPHQNQRVSPPACTQRRVAPAISTGNVAPGSYSTYSVPPGQRTTSPSYPPFEPVRSNVTAGPEYYVPQHMNEHYEPSSYNRIPAPAARSRGRGQRQYHRRRRSEDQSHYDYPFYAHHGWW